MCTRGVCLRCDRGVCSWRVLMLVVCARARARGLLVVCARARTWCSRARGVYA